MADTHIEIRIGAVEFVGTGEADWLDKQLDKILARVEELINLAPQTRPETTHPGGSLPSGDSSIGSMTLPAFLTKSDATKVQVRRFLATAAWLQAKGNDRLSTANVNSALREAHQTKLSNTSDCLNKNVGKGLCEKNGKEFFVTDAGMKELA